MSNATRTLFYNTFHHFVPKCKNCIYFIPRGPKFTNNLSIDNKCKLFAESTKNARSDPVKCGKHGHYFEESLYPFTPNCID
jgi:hypothetical protein